MWSVLQNIYGWNVLITSIYGRIKQLCLFYERFFKTYSKFQICILFAMATGAEKAQTAKMFVFTKF